jgi:hypothetical protein
MGYANDTARLCHEIDQMRAARIELKGRLHRFAGELRRDMNEQRAAMRRRNAEEAARMKAMLAACASNMRQTMRQMMGGFEHERHAAHNAWMRLPAGGHRH